MKLIRYICSPIIIDENSDTTHSHKIPDEYISANISGHQSKREWPDDAIPQENRKGRKVSGER